MAFQKGKSGNPAGRPKGAPNKVSTSLRESITDFLEGAFDSVKADFKKLPPRDRAKLFTDLLQYAVPRLQAASLDIDFANMTDEQLDTIIEKLKTTANGQAVEN